ncbi:hypothetical protein HR080_05225 [Staphylococcus schleiferi subsp. coagulans]|uniref:hypothetical protein n=1 Tax=Staphylococcus coagulans TaxID=74706 RepID=UPI0015F98035|nr:hypothetical protein [Staphylococcus coagulans]MBA8778751.1 hypothetical protein [Staphylococcus coagulans]
MKFNNWNITISGKGSYETVTNEDTLLILLKLLFVKRRNFYFGLIFTFVSL